MHGAVLDITVQMVAQSGATTAATSFVDDMAPAAGSSLQIIG